MMTTIPHLLVFYWKQQQLFRDIQTIRFILKRDYTPMNDSRFYEIDNCTMKSMTDVLL